VKQDFFLKHKLSKRLIINALIIFILLIVGLYVKKYPENTLYVQFKNLYSGFLMLGTQLFLKFSNTHLVFDYTQNIIFNAESKIRINEFFYAFNQLALLFVLALLIKSPNKSKMFFFLAGFLSYALYNIIRISIHTIYPETLHVKNWLFTLLLIPQWLILIFFIDFYWKKYPDFKNSIFEKYKITDIAYNNFFSRLIVVVVFYYLTIVVIYNSVLGEFLVNAILKTSNFFINLSGYDSVLMGRTIRGSQAALYMDDTCIGINLMYLFAAFIFLMPGKTKHKSWFIFAGLTLIIFYNILRIVLIYISIANNEGKYILPVEIHDVFTYPVLIFTFWMWTVWINKFVVKNYPKKQ
jgi:exosortase/archaeosortase family protein